MNRIIAGLTVAVTAASLAACGAGQEEQAVKAL